MPALEAPALNLPGVGNGRADLGDPDVSQGCARDHRQQVSRQGIGHRPAGSLHHKHRPHRHAPVGATIDDDPVAVEGDFSHHGFPWFPRQFFDNPPNAKTNRINGRHPQRRAEEQVPPETDPLVFPRCISVAGPDHRRGLDRVHDLA